MAGSTNVSNSAKADCGDLLEVLFAQVGERSVYHSEADIAWQCFDDVRVSLPNPQRPFSTQNTLPYNGHSLCADLRQRLFGSRYSFVDRQQYCMQII
ncbi:hypothetical protein [Sideroxyarcus emersonii]|uniref:hypothetical protein n=1 Tax=Sideroxyarcus emersonii TaxID=2764705 RepID=UPI001F3C53D2|nr:hypothetical protein [Sideroxyarcus emersonii]